MSLAVSNAPVKRKASDVDTDDFENIDPSFFSKRSKGTDTSFSKDVDFKPSAFTLTKASFSPSLAQPLKAQPSSMPRPRSVLQPRSPAAKLNTSVTSPSLTAPAGRSPTRGSKRIGILSKRRTTRVAPPVFGLGGAGSATPFSLDAALKGTISNYAGRSSSSLSSSLAAGSTASLHDGGSEAKNSWFFDIHEDTPEQEMTNLLQHSTCTLDISSDEESEQRATRERAEGRDKENIPPADDISQTSRAARRAENEDDMVIEKARGPLLEMNAADYYAEGCDDSSVIIVPADDDAEPELPQEVLQVSPAAEEEAAAAAAAPEPEFEFAPELKHDVENISVDAIMGKELPGDKAAVLAPIEGSGESFELWESGSAKDDCEIPGSPALAAEALGSE